MTMPPSPEPTSKNESARVGRDLLQSLTELPLLIPQRAVSERAVASAVQRPAHRDERVRRMGMAELARTVYADTLDVHPKPPTAPTPREELRPATSDLEVGPRGVAERKWDRVDDVHAVVAEVGDDEVVLDCLVRGEGGGLEETGVRPSAPGGPSASGRRDSGPHHSAGEAGRGLRHLRGRRGDRGRGRLRHGPSLREPPRSRVRRAGLVVLRVRFRYAGRGDAVVLEWEDGGERRVGFVDANVHGGANPALESLKAAGYGRVEFVVLSHPHRDHYSGLEALLLHCEREGVRVIRFAHTAVNPTFLQAVAGTATSKTALVRLYETVSRLSNAGVIEKVSRLNDDVGPLPLGGGLRLEVASPSDAEFREFERLAYRRALGEPHVG